MLDLSLSIFFYCCEWDLLFVAKFCWELILFLISVLFVMGGLYLVLLSIDFLFAVGGASDMLSKSESDSEFIF